MKTIRNRVLVLTIFLAAAAMFAGWHYAPGDRETQPQPEIQTLDQGLQPSDSSPSSLLTLEQLREQISACEEAWQLADLDSRKKLMSAFAATLEEPVIRQMLGSLDRVAAEPIRGDLRLALYERWAGLNPHAALDYAEEHLNEAEKMGVLVSIIRQWSAGDARGAAEWVRGSNRVDLMQQVAVFLVPALETVDWVLAGDFVVALSPGQMQNDLTDKVVTDWNVADFGGALRWAKQLSAGLVQQRALVHLSYRWEQVDVSGALTFAQSLPEGNDQLVTLLTSRWAARDPLSAAAWVSQLPEGARKDQLIACTTSVWATKNPEAAAAYVASLPAGDAQSQAAVSAVSAWSVKDPAAAAKWVEQFPEGRARESAIENVVYRWVQTNPDSAVAWLEQWPGGSDRDAAINAGAGSLVEKRPDMAARWAGAIGNEQLRYHQMERAARRWLQTDRMAALAWLAESDLPADRKSQLQ